MRHIILAALLLAGCASHNDGLVKGGFLFDVKWVAPASVPGAVKAESSNPTLHSPYTGNDWGPDQIGSYDPNPLQTVIDLGVFMEISEPREPDTLIQPYGRVHLRYAFGPKKGEEYIGNWSGDYKKSYTHSVDMRGAVPSEYVLYLYDMERKAIPLAPEAGVRLNLSEGLSLQIGMEYERVTWKYYKGIEAYGDDHLDLIASDRLDVLTAKIGIDLMNSESFKWTLGGLVPFLGEKGGGGFLTFQVGF